jgi:hypothetical protein
MSRITIGICVIGMVASVWAVTRCSPAKPTCLSGETRCNGQAAEVCNSNGTWDISLDCGELSQRAELPLVCVQDPDNGAMCEMEVQDAQ